MALCDEIKCLAEAKKEDDINDAEGCHVTQNHAIDHCHKRTSQGYCTEIKQTRILEKVSKKDPHMVYPAKNMR